MASKYGHLPVVSALLDRGADVAAVTRVSFFTPVYLCFLLLNGLLCVVVGWLDGTARGVAERPPAGGGRAP